MKRKIKFPLILKNDVEVRTLEELRENFDLEKIIVYYLDEKLQRWLKDRNYIDELDKIEHINKDNIGKQLCKIFEVKENTKDLNTKEIIKYNERVNKLKQYTDDEKWLSMIDKIVFDQEELNDRLSEKAFSNKKIYLCGEEFDISDTKKYIEYIGVNNPKVFIMSKSGIFDAEEKNILFKNLNISSREKILLKLKYINKCEIDEGNVVLDEIYRYYENTMYRLIEILIGVGNLKEDRFKEVR